MATAVSRAEDSAVMARMPRFFLPDTPLHIIARGNNRMTIFVDDDDRRFFLAYLSHVAARHALAIHAYVLMTNHVHVLATPATEASASRTMHALGLVYARYFNDRYARTGTLWEGRYRASVIDDDQYLLTCMRYIELNPVRAHIVALPGEYPWSSHRCNAYGRYDPLVTPHALFLTLASRQESRNAVYRDLFESTMEDEAIARIREGTHRGWAVGDDGFCTRVDASSRRARPSPRGRKTRPPPCPAPN
jgi:putative transposase